METQKRVKDLYYSLALFRSITVAMSRVTSMFTHCCKGQQNKSVIISGYFFLLMKCANGSSIRATHLFHNWFLSNQVGITFLHHRHRCSVRNNRSVVYKIWRMLNCSSGGHIGPVHGRSSWPLLHCASRYANLVREG